MRHSSTRVVFAYWDALRGDRLSPDRAEIEPSAIRHALADTLMLEIDTAAGHPFRLAGTRLCALFGRELKGSAFVDLWTGAACRDGHALVETVLGETAAVVAGVVATTRADRTVLLELLLLPLRHARRPNSRILGVLSASESPEWLGRDAVADLSLRSLRVIGTAMRHDMSTLLPPSGAFGRPEKRGHLTVYRGGK
jgi:hypothetical protein